MTCQHGFIGACAICDGSGQMPDEADDDDPGRRAEHRRQDIPVAGGAPAAVWEEEQDFLRRAGW